MTFDDIMLLCLAEPGVPAAQLAARIAVWRDATNHVRLQLKHRPGLDETIDLLANWAPLDACHAARFPLAVVQTAHEGLLAALRKERQRLRSEA